MDLSIKDLIVKTARPVNGLQGMAPQLSPAGAGAASSAAFNDLLHSFRAARAETRIADRGANDARPARRESDPRNDKPATRADDKRNARDSDGVTEVTREPFNEAPVTVDVTMGDTAVPAPPHTPAGAPGVAPMNSRIDVAAPERVAVAAGFDISAPPTPAVTGTVGTSATPQQGEAIMVTGPVAEAGTTALSVMPNTGSVENPGAARPAVFRDLTATVVTPPASMSGEDAAALASAVLNKPGPATGTTPGASTPSAEDTIFSPTHRPLPGDAPPRGAELPRLNIVIAPEPEVSPLRAPMTPGLLALQEVSGGGAQTQGSGSAAAAPAGTPAPATPTATAAPPPAAGADTLAAASLVASPSASNTEPAAPVARSQAPFNAGVIGTPGVTAPGTAKIAQAASAQATRMPATMPIPVNDVAVHIARAAASGVDHINIKLKPAALGEVEVKLELTHDGRVAAVVTAERADTLDILARDAKSLERALADAGLKTDHGSLQFNLRGDGQQNGMAQTHTDDGRRQFTDGRDTAAQEGDTDAALAGYANARAASGGIDIRV